MDIISRLNEFVTSKGITSSQFSDSLELPRPSISQILNGRNKKISNELLERIHQVFPTLNINWLLFGEGNMYNSQTDSDLEMQMFALSPSSESLPEPDTDKESLFYSNLFKDENESTQQNLNSEEVESHKTQIKEISINKTETSTNNDNDVEAQNNKLDGVIKSPIKKDTIRRIKSLVVFYTDDTYEVFKKAEF